VPGHPDELERFFHRALSGDDAVYIRMSEEENVARVDGDGIVVLRRGSAGTPLVLAVGPTLSETLAATADLDVTVAYTATPRPFDADGLRALADRDVVLVEPYLAGTSTAEVAAALVDRPTRIFSIGVPRGEFRHYGTPAEHRAAHGLDAAGIRLKIQRFMAGRYVVPARKGHGSVTDRLAERREP
jgi:transketolase